MLWYCFYNFCRVHKSLRVTPAMAAGITDREGAWLLYDKAQLIAGQLLAGNEGAWVWG
jgi:hypothetical protein